MTIVALKITPDLMRMILHLPASHHITGARLDTITGPTGWLLDLLVLDVDAPDAPPGVVEMAPSYIREPPDAPDPVSLREVVWLYPDGTRPPQPTDTAPE